MALLQCGCNLRNDPGGLQLHNRAQKTLEQSGFNPNVRVVVTDLGIEKIGGPVFKADECKAVMDKVKEELGA
jgi:uncharacterized metal-binding protein